MPVTDDLEFKYGSFSLLSILGASDGSFNLQCQPGAPFLQF